ncbi:NUDIX hydrolase [Curvibacter sp. RS43]|uniref:NUDIX hydrolase n=1 Tax=Curvibacter microcysteis TaxID=3026419 RepID=UPI0023606730|nr:NUDIX hydrolase [Curvibacter sp. RS43]MDD0809172.1 NUDIX hydrolase [Curvibacter sp. RS43]
MAIEINSEVVAGAPTPSASVIVLRDGRAGLELLMMRRHGRSAVLGGVHVFPGGKLEASDHLAPALADPLAGPRLAQALNEPGLDPAIALGLYVAALRETLEECGLLLGHEDPQTVAEVLRRWQGGEGFVALHQALGLPLATASLAPWSRWITPRVPSVTNKRFDTRFFVCAAPQGQTAAHDNHEATEALWTTPRAALQSYWRSEIELAPPQIMTLSQLARCESVDQVWTQAHQGPPALIEPEPFDQDGLRVICYPGDPRHSRPEPAWDGPTRLTFRNQRFEPEGGLAALLP